MKSIFASKTIWFNVLTALAAIIAAPEIASVISPQTLLIAVTIINVALRLITTQPVGIMGEDQ